ncbi:cation:proton antiporter [Phenylobacterium sp.]|uniref:cation:proton antiporter n=1 Tax=Phenylobacterium sp. TaxID=1871053 RepID=UPI0025E40B70|nr:cation:proton antiporter [Phenylobacterium sp.]
MTLDPYLLFLFGLGLVILMIAWLPLALRSLPLTLAIICVGVGVAVFATGALAFEPDPRTYDTLTERLTEMVVIIALMGAGVKIDRPIGWRSWTSTWRLLLIAMPITILGVTLLGVGWLGLPLALALLLGAALAPTDPVLAADVQVGPPASGEENEVRFALTSEAGLNDGLAFPFVHLALSFAAAASLAGPDAWPAPGELLHWFAMDFVWRIAAGVAVGWLIGRGLGWLTFDLPRVRLSATGDGLVALGATFVTYGLAEFAHGYGFLAVFVAALTLRSRERDHEYHRALHDFAEQVERLLIMLVLVLFGGAIAQGLFASLTWIDVVGALVILLVIRPLAGRLCLLGVGQSPRDRWLIAFLGIRGIGSFYYVAYGINHGDFGSSERLWAITGLVVLLSILMHGVAATPLMRLIEGPPPQRRQGDPDVVD